MTSIEKTTIPITKAAIGVVFIAGLIANYYTTVNAVKTGISDLRSETQMELANIRKTQELMQKDISQYSEKVDEIRSAVKTYLSENGVGLKPEEIRRKKYN